MKKILFIITVFASLCLLPDFIVSAAENGVTYLYPSEDILVIGGNGVVPGQDFEDGLDDEKVTKLGTGKIAKSKGRKYKITYDLLGGKKSGKLPSSYTYGKSIKLPLNAKKKNYALLGWYNPADTNTYRYYLSKTSPTLSGNIMLRPFWVKYKIRAVGNRSVEIFLDDRNAVVPFGAFDVRYSTNKNMKDAKYFHISSQGKKCVIRNLQKGKSYYFQVAYTDNDMEEWGDTWVGKRRIAVR